MLTLTISNAQVSSSRYRQWIPILQIALLIYALVNLLEKAGLDTRQCLAMLSMERPYRRVRTLVDGYLDKYVTQRFSAIDSLFLAYGLKDFSKKVQGRLRRQNVLSRIEVLVLRRHEIVHAGDLNAHGRLRRINADDAFKRIEDINRFVGAAEALLNNFLKIKRLPSPAQELGQIMADAWKIEPDDQIPDLAFMESDLPNARPPRKLSASIIASWH